MTQENGAALSLVSLERDETCAFLAPDSMTGCRAPRSCQSCLDIAGCMISTSGKCVSQLDEAYDPARGYERAIADGLALPNATSTTPHTPQEWLFPAGRITYCSTSDAVCRTCRRANFWRTSREDSASDSRFCLGESGACVCVDVCERPPAVRADCSSRRITTSMPVVSPSSDSRVGITADSGGQRDWQALVGATIFAVVALGFLLRARRVAQISSDHATARDHINSRHLAHQRRQLARREARAVARGGNVLSLTGWETHRRDLIAKEATQLAGNQEMAIGPSHPDTSRDGDLERGTAYVRISDEEPSGNAAPLQPGLGRLVAVVPQRVL